MTFWQALTEAKQKAGLIGTRRNGARLDEIIIAPTGSEEFAAFKRLYVKTLSAEQAVAPFINSDVMVLGVYDKHRIVKENALIVMEI